MTGAKGKKEGATAKEGAMKETEKPCTSGLTGFVLSTPLASQTQQERYFIANQKAVLLAQDTLVQPQWSLAPVRLRLELQQPQPGRRQPSDHNLGM